jgi:hypothetical protein
MNVVRNTISKIMVHTIAVYVAMLASVLLAMLLILIVPAFGQATGVGRVMDPPFWLPQIVCGAIVGWIVRRHSLVSNPGFGILFPLCLLLWNILTEGLRMRNYTPLIDIYFSGNNGDTEGMYKLVFTAPLYTGIAYTLGALASRKLIQRTT